MKCKKCKSTNVFVEKSKIKSDPSKNNDYHYDFFHETITCKSCGHVDKSTIYPNLLSDMFSLKTREGQNGSK